MPLRLLICYKMHIVLKEHNSIATKFYHAYLNFFMLEAPKRVSWRTLKTRMKERGISSDSALFVELN